MKSTKKFNELEVAQRLEVLKNVVPEFFKYVQDRPNVLSANEVYSLSDNNEIQSKGFFSALSKSSSPKTFWMNSVYLAKETRINRPVIFGLKGGVVFRNHEVIFLKGYQDEWITTIYNILENYKIENNRIYQIGHMASIYSKELLDDDVIIFKEFFSKVDETINRFNLEIENEIHMLNDVLNESKSNILLELDKNFDGKIDLVENDFNKLLLKNQKKVIETDKEYVHKFVKVSNFIKIKKENTQKIFESIRDTSSQEELEERVNLLKNQIHAYELLIFHSINMIGALVSEDLITFYEIYESFDKLGMFNSNWENEVSEKLSNIGDKLDDLMYSIDSMERNIVNGLSQLTYVTQEGFSDLERSVTKELQSIDSTIKFNNLLTGISTYQLYKINKNVKGLG